jgi:succinate-semialdehyde dehydrogenase/glutarate-semialdehyde dehydrogenase
MQTYTTYNPFSQKALQTYTFENDSIFLPKIEKTAAAFPAWRKVEITEKAKLFEKMAHLLIEKRDELAQIATQEMGKPLTQARAEVEKCAKLCRYYAQQADLFLSEKHYTSNFSKSYVRYEPLGTIFAIMPWNFPYWQVFRFAVPTLMAGNTALLKHAPNTLGCALAISNLFAEAGFPTDVFQNLILKVEDVEKVIAAPSVRAVTLTGSERAGASVAALAGKYLKKSVLELGGSDPFIVLADADLEVASNMAVLARCQNSGQSCIAAKRFLVVKEVAEEFTTLFKSKMEKLVVGDPMSLTTQVGTLARPDLADTLEKQVTQAIREGARLLLGGKRQDNFFFPTILTDVSVENIAFRQELFGAVAALSVVEDEAQAVAFANASVYGLGASIWTRDTEKAEKMAQKLESGSVFINQMVQSDPILPFGGIKNSGFGRELSDFGIREFCNIKTVVVS